MKTRLEGNFAGYDSAPGVIALSLKIALFLQRGFAEMGPAYREELIARLQGEDRNGCYSDEDALLEFGRVWTIDDLEASAVRLGFETCVTCGEFTADIEAYVVHSQHHWVCGDCDGEVAELLASSRRFAGEGKR
tara:strand:- start:557 stop:958 length:402 start_codon:yes stop_codon:yes gene_type:complete